MNKYQIGKIGEDMAAEYLRSKGYQIAERNFFTPYGEIDILALSPKVAEKEYVFVEVKTRRFQQDGNPGESITIEKKEHMIDSAMHYMQQILKTDDPWRIDVVTVEFDTRGKNHIRHYENAFFE